MGCDIHAYIDYDKFQTKDGSWRVSCWAEDIELGRDYILFALMAGVRYDPRTDGDFKPLFQPRGLPASVSYGVTYAYTLGVSDEDWAQDSDGYCSTEQAIKWTTPYQEGWKPSSIWMNDDHTRISHPDWHSASYLTVEELEQVAEAYAQIEFPEQSWFQLSPPDEQPIPDNATATKMVCKYSNSPEWYVEVGEKRTYPVPTALLATIAAMKEINQDNPNRSRLVFWFDN